MITKQEERTMNENMSIEQQLQKIDGYINWLNADWENHKKMQKHNFMYQDEYVEHLERRKWLITEGHGLDNWDRKFLNEFEKLINENK